MPSLGQPQRQRRRKQVLHPPGDRSRRSRGRRLTAVAAGGILILLVAAIALLAGPAGKPRTTITRDVTIAGVPVEGCSEQEALQKVERDWVARLPGAVTIAWPGGARQIAGAELGVSLLVREAVRSALLVGTEGGLISRLRVALRVPGDVTDIPVRVSVDRAALRRALQKLETEVYEPPQDATVVLRGGEVADITPEAPGVELDLDASVQAAETALKDPAVDRVALKTRQIPPDVVRKDLERIDAVLATYTTRFRSWQKDRSHNVRLAASQLRCVLLMPGDAVSINDTIGPRLEKLGYREAPIFVNGEVEPSTGGGICQVATTVYNAVLLAALDVLERHHHSRPVDYAPAGRDATLYWGQCDLRIRNTLSAPVVITASAGESSLTVRVLGSETDKREVTIERSGITRIPFATKEKPDPTLPLGKRKVDKPGRTGTRVTVSRTVRVAGGEASREVLHTDTYAPADEVVLVGTQPPVAPGNEIPPPGGPVPPGTVPGVAPAAGKHSAAEPRAPSATTKGGPPPADQR